MNTLADHLAALVPPDPQFRTHDEVKEAIRKVCAEDPGRAAFHELGRSEEGRPLYGVVLGTGPRTVSLIAGNHADEPVGPETLRAFVLGAPRRAALAPLLARYRFVVVPHTNPDGEVRNRAWMVRWPDLGAFLRYADREPPGRDLEFGFPAMRPENRAVAAFLRAHAPVALHMSLHGMAFAEGGMLLIERHWCGARTEPLRARFATTIQAAGLTLHDHNRRGEKGFFYIEPGFTTTPEGAAMRAHFLARGEPAMANRFHDSSMEFVRSLGGDPLCLVTELPLFVIPSATNRAPGVPANYLAFKERLAELRLRTGFGDDPVEGLQRFAPTPLALRTAMEIQLRTIAYGLEALPEALP
ncbi:MAG: M14 family zinc carboxypeptidase [Rhodothermales bacterium]|nr:M14 family zinc carboxypeptidase [Rhodothermales bacterium]